METKFTEWYGRRPFQWNQSYEPVRRKPASPPPSCERRVQASLSAKARHQSRKRPFHSYQPTPGSADAAGKPPM